METVILAGGRGSRLSTVGVMPPYFKPLMVVDGRPLITRLVNQAFAATGDDVIVIAAPENALVIKQVLEHRHEGARYHMVVQTEPNGPGAALELGLRMAESSDVLVLMGDNLMPYADVNVIAEHPQNNVVGVTEVEYEQTIRLTYKNTDGIWVEKEYPYHRNGGAQWKAWVGPFKCNASEMRDAIHTWSVEHEDDPEIPIGPLFNELRDLHTMPVNAFDLGTPEELS